MRVPVGVTSCLCPLLVFLWFISQGCCGSQVCPSQKTLRSESRLDTTSYLKDNQSQPKEPVTKPSPLPSSGSNARLASLSSPKPHPKVPLNPKISKTNSFRVQRNDTKAGWIRNQFFVLEEHVGPEPQYVGKLHSNSDQGDGSVRYILSGEGAGSIFLIDQTTGDIHAAKTVDRETKSQYVLHAKAIDRRTNRSLEAESEFIIKVQDVNDNAPMFPDGPSSATVPEMSDVGTSVFQVTASDADDPSYGNSAKIVYSILEGGPYFSIDPKSGIIRTAMSNLDRETRDHYAVVVQAKDMVGSVGGLSGSTTVNITLTDINDNPPRFLHKTYQIYVPEVAPVGGSVGRIRADDEDEGRNGEMIYSITNVDAASIFTITTDIHHREGVVFLKKPLDYEKKKVHTINVEVSNRHPDPRFSYLGPFKDSTTVRVLVGDVDEPPVFSMDHYIMDAYENSPAGTQVGSVTAADPDSTSSAVRFFMENQEDGPSYFSVGVKSGVIRTTRVLDREETAWHNVTVKAAEIETPGMMTLILVTIQVLDVNDNVPTVSGGNRDVIVCDTTRRGQVVWTLGASDPDTFANGRFSFYTPSGLPVNPNFTVRDNGDSTASIVSRRRPASGYVVVAVADGGEPPLSSTATVTLRVCACQVTAGRHTNAVCQDDHFLSTAGLSTGAVGAGLFCVAILVAVASLFVLLRNRKSSKDLSMTWAEDVRENVVAYDEEGGGEEDTEAFNMAALRNPKTSFLDLDLDYGQEVDYGSLGATWLVLDSVPRDFGMVVQQVLEQKVVQANWDTRGPPYDSLQTYAYEGRGSSAGSLSSLGLN